VGAIRHRCPATDLVPSQRAEHPSTAHLREDGVVDAPNARLHSLLDPSHVEATVDHLRANRQ
jgi:hypothetical protein